LWVWLERHILGQHGQNWKYLDVYRRIAVPSFT
jgi:hypothetical protein